MAATRCIISCVCMHACPSSSKLMCSAVPQTQRGLHINTSAQSSILTTTSLEKTRRGLRRDLDPLTAMKLIDSLQCLGVAYHYQQEIHFWLGKLSEWDASHQDLNATALRFRLLRQNGIPVCSDVFEKFTTNPNQKFRKCLSQDKEGLLNLYEASYLGAKGEDILSEAMRFSETELRLSTSVGGTLPHHLSRRVRRALELPSHLRMERLENRFYIHDYATQINHTSLLLDHAISDYNQIQSLYQTELAEISRWWKQLGLVEKLSFARDRPMECFLWTVGILPEPKYSGVRIELAKTIAILLVIDDIFDTYGTMDELSLFMHAIQRWDLEAIEGLPEYMKICYMALFNTTNEIAYKVLKDQGRNVLPFLAKTWIETIEAFMSEAQWFSNGSIPINVEDYLENGVTTSGAYMALVHAFLLMGQGLTPQNIKLMSKPYPKLFSNSGRILRLWDDLGTAKEEEARGDNASMMTLLMKEKNMGSGFEAGEHMMQLIPSLWKDLNMELLSSNTLPLTLIRACFNMSRTAQLMYQHQEHSYLSSVDKFVNLILWEPISSSELML
ncbi:putative terpene synthase 11 [Sesamum alatum]|uniref:Terpene synthase 11 n=1 Tax=Sesamum alatum TaxID=300844 RepID=A0AAE2CWS8_9LAMI|nr:putative terpene synthase 11 [Sesamum alatum]